MATHECSKCLKETNKSGNLSNSAMVAPGSICNAGVTDGPHNWVALGKFLFHLHIFIYFIF